SLPGYGFSGPTHERGWDTRRIASAFAELMVRLGYDRYGAQGGDWGAMVSTQLALLDPAHVCGIHVNLVIAGPPPGDDLSQLTRPGASTTRRGPRAASGWEPSLASRSRRAVRCSRVRSPAHPGAGRRLATTSPTGRRCRRGATSPPWRSPSSSSTMYARSSARCDDGTRRPGRRHQARLSLRGAGRRGRIRGRGPIVRARDVSRDGRHRRLREDGRRPGPRAVRAHGDDVRRQSVHETHHDERGGGGG